MNQGKIVQIIGAVVDVEFPRTAIPRFETWLGCAKYWCTDYCAGGESHPRPHHGRSGQPRGRTRSDRF